MLGRALSGRPKAVAIPQECALGHWVTVAPHTEGPGKPRETRDLWWAYGPQTDKAPPTLD